MNTLTTFSYEGSKITFASTKGIMVNATQMAKSFRKTPKDWLRTDASREFIATLSAVRQICLTELIVKKQGGNGEQGTWMHEDVAIEFARWLSPAFAIWCNDRIKELLTATPQHPAETPQLPPPDCKTLSISALVEAVEDRRVTTSRKLAQLLGRKHDSILDTIKANRHQRWFKYGNFTRRAYTEGKYSHGSEYLITRRGLSGLSGIMRSGAREKIKAAYEGAWEDSQKPSAAVIPARSSERTWTESEVAELIMSHARKMSDHLRQVVQTHREKGEQWYGPAGEVGLGVPLFFEGGLESAIEGMFRSLSWSFLDAYAFRQDAETYRSRFREAKRFVEEIIKFVKND